MTDDGKQKEKAEHKNDNPSSVIHNPSTEIGGRGGLDPTRYGDWEIAGKCVDF